jgi:hypothetical protein
MKTKKIKNAHTRWDLCFRRMFFIRDGNHLKEYRFMFGHHVDEVFALMRKKRLAQQWKINGRNLMVIQHEIP